MTKLHVAAGLVALALLSACGGQEPPVNAAKLDEGLNTDFVVPEGNAAADNVAMGNAGDMATAPALNLAPDGLTIVSASGSARQVAFDLPRDQVLGAVGSVLGQPVKRDHNDECGSGPMDMADYKGGLTLFFSDGRFAGWDVDGREHGSYSTAAGIGIGSTLKQLRGVVSADVDPSSSLGIEFNSGGLSGLLSANTPEGRITHLWAGNSCIFR